MTTWRRITSALHFFFLRLSRLLYSRRQTHSRNIYVCTAAIGRLNTCIINNVLLPAKFESVKCSLIINIYFYFKFIQQSIFQYYCCNISSAFVANKYKVIARQKKTIQCLLVIWLCYLFFFGTWFVVHC